MIRDYKSFFMMVVAMYGLVHDVETINHYYNGCCHVRSCT